jgi:hypothetical protein
MMHLGGHTHVLLSWGCCHPGRIRNPGRARATWPSHVVTMRRRRDRLTGVHLRLSPHATTPQSRILVAVTPAVNGPLNQAALASQAGVQLRERPTDGIAFSLVMQTVSLVLIFAAACTRVDAVLGLEVLGKFVDVDGFDIAANRVLHLHPIARVFESNPLHAVLVLPHNKRGSRRNRSRRSGRVNVRWRSSGVHVWRAYGWALLWRLLRRCS